MYIFNYIVATVSYFQISEMYFQIISCNLPKQFSYFSIHSLPFNRLAATLIIDTKVQFLDV